MIAVSCSSIKVPPFSQDSAQIYVERGEIDSFAVLSLVPL